MTTRYGLYAGYNAWANERLYEAVARLPDAGYRADRGAFFGSIHGTLNHLLVADRIWMFRFTGEGSLPRRLDEILYEDFATLREARRQEDLRISRFIAQLGADELEREIQYETLAFTSRMRQPLCLALDHFFNHQTHHRGQVHALLTAAAGRDGAPSLDLLLYQREVGAAGGEGPLGLSP